jgi:hypothetical protein
VDIDAGIPEHPDRRLCPTGRQNLAVARLESRAFLLVLFIQRQDQQLPKGVRVNVEGYAVNVWDRDTLPAECLPLV